MLVEILVEDDRWQNVRLAALAETAASATLSRLGIEPGMFEVSLMGCDDARISELNAEFRAKQKPTNVLSWPAQALSTGRPGETPVSPEIGPMGPTELGDIALAYETCRQEADTADKSLDDHVTHLIVHAMLHLLGYDHINDQDAALMEELEVDILATLGLPDPYMQSNA
ncbi:rRNA maturation RNase YbeY [Parasulfitobacter algicola]|uniref:Endoribonuclease YbeY n=1 Tax=Parasulfitobacter algicola TaxID=2614809 RepID=A0ABX2ISR4_9RHOB|nr:rRNA maturation RNase YbeY [Sulfitobacter algicola]NSX55921.1 rRNA maturation RNase YbeY [Sulfitobacter algicola]